jgi:hypothetical protein
VACAARVRARVPVRPRVRVLERVLARPQVLALERALVLAKRRAAEPQLLAVPGLPQALPRWRPQAVETPA